MSFLMDDPVPKFLLHFYALIMPFLSQFNLSSLPDGIPYNIIPMGPGLYIILCLKTDKIYVGESSNICGRLSTHWLSLNNHIHDCIELQSDWITFGQENFCFACLCVGPEWSAQKERIAKENEIIKANSNKVYNSIDKTKKEEHKYCKPVQWEQTIYPSVAAAARACIPFGN
jgi:hypothetical protein